MTSFAKACLCGLLITATWILPSHTSVVFHRRGDGLPNLTGTYDFDACQVVATHLGTEIFLHELTNITGVLSPPNSCGVFVGFS